MPQTPYYPVNNNLGAIVTLSAASASGDSPAQISGQTRGVKVVVDITAISGTSPTLTVTIEGYDSASSTWYTLLASSALSATGETVLTVYPGVSVTANQSASDHIPAKWRVAYTIAGTTPAVTATIGACLLV
jgi:hypothetical protein